MTIKIIQIHVSWYLRATRPPPPPIFITLQHTVAMAAA